MKEIKTDRREFIKRSAVASVFTILPAAVWAGSVAPSDKLNVALIGCRNMGFGDLRNHLSFKDVQCVALCDVDRNILEQRAASIKDDFGQEPAIFGDSRKMLELKDIDAVIGKKARADLPYGKDLRWTDLEE